MLGAPSAADWLTGKYKPNSPSVMPQLARVVAGMCQRSHVMLSHRAHLGGGGVGGFSRGGDPHGGPAGFVCWPASLTEAPAPSLLHVKVKMALVGFIGTRSEHGAEDAAGVIVD
jgi:hypothetical protein